MAEPGAVKNGTETDDGGIAERIGCWAEMYPHLVELRIRIFAVIGFLILAFIASFVFVKRIFDYLLYPLGAGTSLHYFAVPEAFITDIKIALFTALVLTVPVLLFHIWRFIAPGLLENERRVVRNVIPWLFVLFLLGAAFTFYVVAPAGVHILIGWGGERLDPVLSVGRYFSFLFGLVVAGGVLFELPVVLVGLAKLGWVTRASLLKHFKTAIVIILILSAILTPSPDAFTMLLLAGPIIVLYFLSVLLVGMVRPFEEAESARISKPDVPEKEQ